MSKRSISIALLILALTFQLISSQKLKLNQALKMPKFFQKPCFPKVDFDLDKYCENFDKRCKVCFSMDYISKCLRFCQDGDCKCEGIYLSYCKELYSLCFECSKSVINCQCPTGLDQKNAGWGKIKCVLPDCPDGQYRPLDSKCVGCEPCGEHCKKCVTGQNQCEKCKDNYCMVNGKCISKDATCPKGTIKVKDKNGCFDCMPPSQCQPGTFPNFEKGECEKCPTGCKDCVSLEKCTKCYDSYCLINNKCISKDSKCPKGTFKILDSILKSSFKSLNKILQKYFNDDQCFECLKPGECPPNTWEDPITQTCNHQCDKPKFIWRNHCIEKCPHTGDFSLKKELRFNSDSTPDDVPGSWRSNTKNKLLQCGSNFYYGEWSANEEIQTSYSNFKPGQKLQFKFNLLMSDNLDHNDYVYILYNNRKIIKINLDELKTQSKNPTNCGINEKGIQMWTGQLTKHMTFTENVHTIIIKAEFSSRDPNKFWAVRNWELFIPNADLFMYQNSDGEYVCTICTGCPEGTFCNDRNKQCDKCSKPNFFYKQQCISNCPENTFKSYIDGNPTCVEQCPPKFYADSKGECKKCNKPCNSCIGSPDTCQYPCEKPLIWNDFKCVKECPKGHFAFSVTNVNYADCKPQDDCMCGPCHDTCEKCIGPKSNQCTKCKDKLLLSDGSCVAECPEAKFYFQDSEQKRCECCDKICSNCTGPRIDQCTSCIAGATLIGSTCHLEWDVSGYSEKHSKTPDLKKLFHLR